MDQLPRLGKRELIRLLSFTCYYVVSVWVLGTCYVILSGHSLSLPYNYFETTALLNLQIYSFFLLASFARSYMVTNEAFIAET